MTDPVAGDARMPPEVAAALAALRERSGIRLDREGRFWHLGALIEHPGIEQAFHRWLTVDEQGRFVLRTDRDWCVVEVEDAPLVVRSVELHTDGVELSLSDGTREALDPATLAQSDEHVLYCRTRRGFWARFSRPAYYALAERCEVDESGRAWLVIGERRAPIGTRQRAGG